MLKTSSWDPRIKLLFMICVSTVALVTNSVVTELIVVGAIVLVLILADVKFIDQLRKCRTIVGFIALIFIAQCFGIRSGESMLEVGSVTLITEDGLMMGGVMSLRLLVFVLSALFLLTTPARDYLLAMVQCHIPYELAFMVMIAFHFFPILRREAMDVYYSIQLRGKDISKCGIIEKIRIYLDICVPILVGALDRAKSMSMAMECRGFKAKDTRTYLHKLNMNTGDCILVVILPVITVAGIVSDIIV